mmetsp:Transcript_23286/g.88263  ORF Transcript_23286/g.88263 Transcript_23286/m.88263 type:complete len:280 (+) Transcript_23286:230-1069(+)
MFGCRLACCHRSRTAAGVPLMPTSDHCMAAVWFVSVGLNRITVTSLFDMSRAQSCTLLAAMERREPGGAVGSWWTLMASALSTMEDFSADIHRVSVAMRRLPPHRHQNDHSVWESVNGVRNHSIVSAKSGSALPYADVELATTAMCSMMSEVPCPRPAAYRRSREASEAERPPLRPAARMRASQASRSARLASSAARSRAEREGCAACSADTGRPSSWLCQRRRSCCSAGKDHTGRWSGPTRNDCAMLVPQVHTASSPHSQRLKLIALPLMFSAWLRFP